MTTTRTEKTDDLIRRLWYALDCPPSLSVALVNYLAAPAAPRNDMERVFGRPVARKPVTS